jgi:hypothetical protein
MIPGWRRPRLRYGINAFFDGCTDFCTDIQDVVFGIGR